MTTSYFTENTFKFLNNLARNNDREWFNENKNVFEDEVRTPALNFITDFSDELALISRHFQAQPKKVGGSLMRIYRDVRFSKDKRPFKTNIGIQFRHERGKDVHAPGFYLHIEPDECFLGIGIWRPDSQALAKIREHMTANPKRWISSSTKKPFSKHFQLQGDCLIRPPRGYDKDHPLINDLKRKDFIATMPIDSEITISPSLFKTVAARFSDSSEYMHFLCDALELQF